MSGTIIRNAMTGAVLGTVVESELPPIQMVWVYHWIYADGVWD